MDWLADQLGTVHAPDEARLWLFIPNAELNGVRPADLIADERVEEVLSIIDRMQSGAFV